MGGVDKIDQLISTYRTFIKSKKWTLRLIVHAFDLVVANGWIQYVKDAKYLNIQNNKTLDLLHFRLQLANEIINCRKLTTQKEKADLVILLRIGVPEVHLVLKMYAHKYLHQQIKK